MTRVVVIDDSPEICDILSRALIREGYDVATAPDGAVGESLVGAEETALVVTDVIMPNREGLETIFSLRTSHPAIRIIAISGGGRTRNFDVLHLAKRLGADRVLEKPLDRRTFLATVEELVGRPVHRHEA